MELDRGHDAAISFRTWAIVSSCKTATRTHVQDAHHNSSNARNLEPNGYQSNHGTQNCVLDALNIIAGIAATFDAF
jgi:hypothetical protein